MKTTPPTWDLTCSISPHLDLHMMFPLLEFVDSLIDNGLIPYYSSTDVAQARLALLRPTHMVDYAMDIYRELHQGTTSAEVPEEMEQQKAAVYEKLEALRIGCSTLDDLCKNAEERKKLVDSRQWNISGLSNRGIAPEMVEKYRQFAKFNYDCGDYQTARDMITTYISFYALPPGDVTSTTSSKEQQEPQEEPQKEPQPVASVAVGNPKMYYLPSLIKNPSMLEALWGKLSCEILLENWEGAGIALDAVKLGLEELSTAHVLSPVDALVQRTWLLHWGLFVFWNYSTANNSTTTTSSSGLEIMVDLFMSDKYLQAVTTNAPHLLRYLTAAVLLIKRRNKGGGGGKQRDPGTQKLNDLVNIMQHCEYTDPIVEFVDCLCVKFDFELAQQKLLQCERVLESDFFLCRQTALFMEEARVFVFENYCRIHHKIDLAELGEKLAMEPVQAERWIVDLIRTAALDAKIDSEEQCVVMGTDTSSVYELVMERTRDLNIRSSTLTQNLQNLLNDIRKEKVKRHRASMEDEY
mmetsp:Transcript_8679/g.12652  ORF Transcript_8679/g.12652 Transcript_8679/m.12652 type:complete len:523 (-) Transcript_8679:71-1639(-)